MNFRLSFSDSQRVVFSVLTVFCAFYIIEYLTPFHSDDFSYGQMGLDFSRHWNHYMGWSGRLVADYASSFLLMISSHAVISAFIAFFATATCVLVTAIPSKLIQTRFTASKFLIIAFLFWTSNPNIGQTVFWVVGACNYLVTNFFIALFLFLFLHFRERDSVRVRIGLFLSALIAGCTNENSSLALLYTFIALCFLMHWLKIPFNKKSAAIYGIGLTVGMLVLLLAPGNFARANHPAFRWFKETGILGKLYMQVRRIGHLFYFLPGYLLIGLAYRQLFLSFGNEENKKRLIWSLLFLSSSCAAFAVMVGSPSMPSRAYSGIFLFLLISVAFILDVTWDVGKLKIATRFIEFGVIVFAVVSWTFMYISYGITQTQEAIRNDHINYEKLVNGPSARPVVPNYYFVRVLRKTDKFDLFHSGAMASYFGVADVPLQDGVNFDYSILRTGKTVPVVLSNLSEAKVFVRYPTWKTKGNGTVLLETTTNIRGKKIALEYYPPRAKEPSEIALTSEILFLSGKYYAGATVKNLQTIRNLRIRMK